ncbi:hypothetical protein [Methanobrevibacter sp.]|uniref:hypothetical protein n=1 Tax=Methanobrevibacter sp. TaxID=66852 RepID=UPI003864B208
MGIHTEYSCSECGFKLVDSSDIFWIDDEKKIHVDMQTVDSSKKASDSLASGGIYKYYCYNCDNYIFNFHVSRKSGFIEKELVIQLIEDLDDNIKIIDFDNKFQSCIHCRNEVPLKQEKSFAIDNKGEFFIEDSLYNDFDSKQFDFTGKYYGYYCKDCGKQINKFVILENNANLEDSLIKEILEDHTNDLTVYINDSYFTCPICGDELQVLGESSSCPKCRVGLLTIEKQTLFD